MPVYQLKVNGQALALSEDPADPMRNSLTEYELNYDGPAKLIIRFYRDWRLPPFAGDAVVELFVDGVRRFVGHFELPRPYVDLGNERYVEYEAVDLCEHASRLFPYSQFGRPSFTLSPGPLSDVLAQYLGNAQVIEKFVEAGIDPTFNFVGDAALLECFPVSLESASLDAALRQIAAAAAGGAGVFLDASQTPPRYTFVSLYDAPAYDLAIDSTLIEKLDILKSIEGRCGAVQTLAGQTTGSADVTLDNRFEMTKAWSSAPNQLGVTPEQEWTVRDAAALDDAGDPVSLASVYRLFSFASAATPPTVDASVGAEVYIAPDADGANGRWKRAEILKIDHDGKTVLLKEPALKNPSVGRWNPHEPGRAKGARVRLAWSTSTTGSAQINIPSVRYPAEGFAGRVVDLSPVRGRTVKLIAVPPGVNREEWARFAWRALSEPLVRGEVPIVGSLPAELWALSRRVNIVSAQHGPTGHESLLAPVKGVRIEFERGGSARVQLSRDTAALADGGSS